MEVSDLGNLIGLYAEWHSHLLPYYSFDQFVHKVEQVGATRHVKRIPGKKGLGLTNNIFDFQTCLGGLREKVANGGDPTKLHESPSEDATNNDQVGEEINGGRGEERSCFCFCKGFIWEGLGPLECLEFHLTEVIAQVRVFASLVSLTIDARSARIFRSNCEQFEGVQVLLGYCGKAGRGHAKRATRDKGRAKPATGAKGSGEACN
ncbi:unnamed protein product [Thlaspi arvense]|uniref:Chromosome segregation in meiosis protein 3 domain-containing protein n=1 Tax=Thlaspi arvense TaxID=13288 RepID=A0AAU9RFP9_THLAR|nr:unnamed protein product [Thlaspi arvense]